jgi:hypothetical protein
MFHPQTISHQEHMGCMQERHPHTLSCCVVVSGLKKGAADGVDRAFRRFRDAIMEMMERGDAKTPLHLKLVMYQEERERQGRAIDIHLSDVKTVLMPRQYVLKALDPNGTATAEELHAKIVPLARIYHAVVLKDQLPAVRRHWDLPQLPHAHVHARLVGERYSRRLFVQDLSRPLHLHAHPPLRCRIRTASARTAGIQCSVHRQNCGRREEALQVCQGHCWQE